MIYIRKPYLILASCTLLSVTACSSNYHSQDTNEPIGASLTEKTDIAISDVPAAVLAAAQAMRPNVNFTEAERELRNNITYFDVGGEDDTGNEVELDIMQDGDSWRVVEIQRDIEWSQTPEPVRAVLSENEPDVTPDRIIESDQNDGVVIYEFFTRDSDGKETKYEVKLADGKASFLNEEWIH